MSTKEQKIQGRKAELPALCFLNLSAHFYVWVTVWVRRLTHILTHTVSAEKSEKNPRNRMISGIFWSCWADSNRRPHPYQLIGRVRFTAFQAFCALFCPDRRAIRHSCVRCFRPLVSPCGSRCGSKISDLLQELRQHVKNDGADHDPVGVLVVVDQPMPQAGDLGPGNIRVLPLEIL